MRVGGAPQLVDPGPRSPDPGTVGGDSEDVPACCLSAQLVQHRGSSSVLSLPLTRRPASLPRPVLGDSVDPVRENVRRRCCHSADSVPDARTVTGVDQQRVAGVHHVFVQRPPATRLGRAALEHIVIHSLVRGRICPGFERNNASRLRPWRNVVNQEMLEKARRDQVEDGEARVGFVSFYPESFCLPKE